MKRQLISTVVLAAFLLPAASLRAATPAPAKPTGPALKTEEEKTLYALGLIVGGNLRPLRLGAAEMAVVSRGIRDAASGAKPLVDLESYRARVEDLARVRQGALAAAEKKRAAAYQEAAAREAGALRTPSGLVFRTLKAGAGLSPAATDTVSVHYHGTLIDGTVFDSSVQRGQPAEFALKKVIPCWTEGVQKMKVGEKAKLVCPSSIAYGDQGRPPTIPGGATLVFEVELLAIRK